MKILIDTNIYLDFYRSNKEALKLFAELSKHVDKIILTDQIIFEFERSREKVLKAVKQNFETESKLENFSSSYLQDLPSFRELLLVKDSYNKKRKEIIKQIDDALRDESLDPIATFFNNLIEISITEEKVLYTTDDIITKATKRKSVGNPPTSDKYSIGDEINWEIILANVSEDVVIVGRDNTYSNNLTFLNKDFHSRTGKFIIGLTDSISEALKLIGIETTEAVTQAERQLINDVNQINMFWRSQSSENQ